MVWRLRGASETVGVAGFVARRRRRSRTALALALVAPGLARPGGAQKAVTDLSPAEHTWVAASRGHVHISPEGQMPPVGFVSEGAYRGIAADYLALVTERTGVEFTYRLGPLSLHDPARVEVVPMMVRPGVAVGGRQHSVAMLRMHTSLLLRQSQSGVRGLADLRMKLIGVDNQVLRWSEFERDLTGYQLVPIQDTRRGLLMLSFAELDAFITLMPVATYVMDKEGITNLRSSDLLPYEVELVLAVSPPDSPLLGIVNKAVIDLDESDHDAIYRRWVQIGGTSYWLWLLGAVGVLGSLLLGVSLWNRSLARRVASRTEALQRELAERTRVEAALRESEELHRESLVEISDAVFLTDPDGGFRYLSPDVAERLGLPPGSFASVGSVAEIVGEDLFQQVRRGEVVQDARVAIRVPGVDERVLRVNAKSTHVFGRSLLFACRDATEQERAAAEIEAQRRATDESHRMAALGALVSTLAHEVNNPNHTIMLNVPVLRAAWQDAVGVLDQHSRLSPGMRLANIPYADMREDVLRLIDEIHQAADRIRGIVVGLRNYARGHGQQDGQRLEMEPLLAAAVARSRPGIDLVTDRFHFVVENRLPPVQASPFLLTQVFVGLLDKAALEIRDRTQAIDLRARALDGAVEIEVRGEGPASPGDAAVDVTRPFQKAGGSLEVAMAAWIVQQCGGSVRIFADPVAGTKVTVRLPACVEVAEA